MKFAICNEIFQGWTLEQTMAGIAKAGYQAVEIAPFTIAKSVVDVSAADRRNIRAMAARNGLEICGLHWVLARTEVFHITHPDEAVRTRTANYLCDLVDFCADLEGRVIVIGSPKQRSLLPGVTQQQAWNWATSTFSNVVRRAGERDVTICLEPLAPAETDFINTAADALRFTQQFADAHFKIILDVKAMCSETKPIPQIIHESAQRFTAPTSTPTTEI